MIPNLPLDRALEKQFAEKGAGWLFLPPENRLNIISDTHWQTRVSRIIPNRSLSLLSLT